jgi:hypothetical protein
MSEALKPILDALAPAAAYLPTHPASIVTVRPPRSPRRCLADPPDARSRDPGWFTTLTCTSARACSGWASAATVLGSAHR